MAMTQQARESHIEAALEGLKDLGDQYESIRYPWKGSQPVFKVVQISLDSVLLNPRSHRIKAELESSPKREAVAKDPFGEEAQEEISRLLRQTEDYEALKKDLQEHGQLDAGVVTRSGLLINANTRAVALRDLKEKYIKVAVLPADADEQSIEELEAYLQLRVERKQPYSFPNELLFVEDMRKRGLSEEDLALQLGWAAAREPGELKKGRNRVQQYIRMLAIVREVAKLSNGAVPITYFDGKRQTLQEIDDTYEQTKAKAPDVALKVRSARLLGLVARVGYRELREVDETFLADYLPTGLRENTDFTEVVEKLEQQSPAPASDPDLSLFEDPVPAGPTILDVAPLLGTLLNSHGTEKVILPGKSDTSDRQVVLDGLLNLYNTAVEEYKTDRNAADEVGAPLALVKESIKKVNKAKVVADAVKSDSKFDAAAVSAQLDALDRSIKALRLALKSEQARPALPSETNG
jgi:hypothetical protein